MTDESYMRRALQLAAGGLGNVAPNPMVGAVIVHNGRIIGEGYHRRYGGSHAEVNAIASVADADLRLLRESTMYVTLEPCSHFGKTPPCADLLVERQLKRVVVGSLDPFAKVSGRGVAKLRQAGIEVTVGVLEAECRALNRVFMTAHTLHRPYVTLKWAMSRDCFLARRTPDGGSAPVAFSTPASPAFVHAMRARNQAVMVGSGTVIADFPRLNVREFCGSEPLKVVLDRRGRCSAATLASLVPPVAVFSVKSPKNADSEAEYVGISANAPLEEILAALYRRGINSVLVEGGASLLKSFMCSGLWDEARVEVAPVDLNGEGAAHMDMPPVAPLSAERVDGNLVYTYRNIQTPKD